MDEVYWGCYRESDGEMRLVGAEAVLPPEAAALPANASGDWFGAGTGWGYGERIAVTLSGQDAAMLPHAEDLLTLARFAWERGEAIPADDAQPVRLEEHTSELQSLMRISYAVFCLKKKNKRYNKQQEMTHKTE